jgi:hypothetical protein
MICPLARIAGQFLARPADLGTVEVTGIVHFWIPWAGEMLAPPLP